MALAGDYDSSGLRLNEDFKNFSLAKLKFIL